MRAVLLKVRALPLRARWAITIVLYALVIVAIAIVVRSGGGGNGATGASDSSQAEARATEEANREGRIAIAQDEAPHSSPLRRGESLQVALTRAITVDVRARIAHGQLTGPLESVRCQAAASARARRRQLSCTVRSAGITYPFLGVADELTQELTWCKVDPPPVANAPLEVPVSSRCRA